MCVCVQICQAISDVSVTNQKLVDKYKREMNLRKKIHNQLVQLKGWFAAARNLPRAAAVFGRAHGSSRGCAEKPFQGHKARRAP